MTNPLYWLVTITDRRSTDAFLALYESYGVRVSLRTVGAGTAVQEMLATLGLEKSEKAVLMERCGSTVEHLFLTGPTNLVAKGELTDEELPL